MPLDKLLVNEVIPLTVEFRACVIPLPNTDVIDVAILEVDVSVLVIPLDNELVIELVIATIESNRIFPSLKKPPNQVLNQPLTNQPKP